MRWALLRRQTPLSLRTFVAPHAVARRGASAAAEDREPVPVRSLSPDSYLNKILNSRVYDVAKETELQYAPVLSQSGNEVYFKREDQQPVFSFKIRGAYNKIASLTEEELKNGIIACSAGNHAQGVALSAAKLQVDNVIIMPKGTPNIKVDAVKKFGGNVVLHGDNYDEAEAEAMRLVEAEGRTLIHPFDDPDVIAGQGTVGMEILRQCSGREDKLTAIFCCVGGGGLLAGVLAYVKHVRPETFHEYYGNYYFFDRKTLFNVQCV